MCVQVAGWLYSIEWQKRGMPHCHMLLFMEKGHEPNTPERIDRLVKATIPPRPSPDDPPERRLFLRRLRKAVVRHMIHSRCDHNKNAYCQIGAKAHWCTCTKRFPKPHCDFTTIGESNYVTLARPEDGETILKAAYDKENVPHDNSWVVAYNPTLLVALDSHVNVEVL